MVSVTCVAPAPAAICVGLKPQLVAAGRLLPVQAKVTAWANVPPPGVRVKVEVVNPPESTAAGALGSVEKIKVGGLMTWLTVFDVLPPLLESPEYTAVIESVPTGRVLVVMAAVACVPFSAVRVTGLPKITPPFSNDTVPVGTCVPVVVTLAVKVTDTPSPASCTITGLRSIAEISPAWS